MTIINHECYISLEVAKLLKKAGFDWERETCYIGESEHPYKYHKFFNWNKPRKDFEKDGSDNLFHAFITQKKTNSFISAPTLEVAQRWLREVKGIYVESVLCVNRVTSGYSFGFSIEEVSADLSTVKILYPSTYFDEEETKGFIKYELSLDAGIKKALELILEKGELFC